MDDEREDELSVRDLADLAGTTVRTIHYYIAEGLLPPPHGIKRNASYSSAHLARLRLIGALRDEGLALAAIRGRLAPLTDEQALAVVATLDEHLAAGDRSITILGLIEAALTREVSHERPLWGPGADISERVEEAPMQPMQPMSMPKARPAFREQRPKFDGAGAEPRSIQFPASPAPGAASPEAAADSASDYVGRLLRRAPSKRPMPPRPAPLPPPRPRPDPYSSLRPETWHHFEIADGVELRVRDDRYREGRGQLRAVIDSLGPILQRYGLTQHLDDEDNR